MAISARSVCDLLMAAMIALLDLGTERGGTACADVSEYFTLLWGQHVSPAIQKFLTMLVEDIGDFESLFPHRRRPSPSGSRISRIGKPSSGLTVVRKRASETCR